MEHEQEATNSRISGSSAVVSSVGEKVSRLPPNKKKLMLILNCILFSIGNCAGPLMTRLYFIHGGHRIWFRAFIETVGWPFISIILFLLYFTRRTNNHPTTTTFVYMRGELLISIGLIGVLIGLDDYLYNYGFAHLPISTYAIINTTKLIFMAVFAFILVKQNFTPYSVNAVVLLTVGSALLAFHGSGDDRPKGESKKEYVTGFVMTVAAAALYGLVSPLMELIYNKTKQKMTYTLLLEVQMVMCLFATVFCMLGMLFNNDFKVISREAEEFGLGKMKYYMIIGVSIILWQCFFLGSIGVIQYGSSLLLGVVATLQIPITEIFAVVFYKEKFNSEKGIALVLSLWGFLSFFYGDYKYMKIMKQNKPSTLQVV